MMLKIETRRLKIGLTPPPQPGPTCACMTSALSVYEVCLVAIHSAAEKKRGSKTIPSPPVRPRILFIGILFILSSHLRTSFFYAFFLRPAVPPVNRWLYRITLLCPVWGSEAPCFGHARTGRRSCCRRSRPDSLVRWTISAVGTSWRMGLADVAPRASWFRSMAVPGDMLPLSVAYAGKNFEGVQGRGSGLVGGPGAEPPGRQRIFENLQKIP